MRKTRYIKTLIELFFSFYVPSELLHVNIPMKMRNWDLFQFI